ncbi:hypothetical protein OR16_34138 [Cupriavidus basilensis OR16]|uniref:Uncharacterized protein n=1 Tax=Cupriavidus basilensis OR16 TaxID=1127483 RepID=H1SET6_9BURK|nr:hypothetical protein OR16_34138 [Cupriavidus basilensis OR16]
MLHRAGVHAYTTFQHKQSAEAAAQVLDTTQAPARAGQFLTLVANSTLESTTPYIVTLDWACAVPTALSSKHDNSDFFIYVSP